MKTPGNRRLATLTAIGIFGLSAAYSSGAIKPKHGCEGKSAVIRLSEARYPNVVDHIEDAGLAHKTMRVNRRGAEQRRERLLSWYTRRHKQPKNDGLDLDEQSPAMLRSSWKASVRPVPESENRSQGAMMGNRLRGVPNGTCVRYKIGA